MHKNRQIYNMHICLLKYHSLSSAEVSVSESASSSLLLVSSAASSKAFVGTSSTRGF